jgi:hypothetical protein
MARSSVSRQSAAALITGRQRFAPFPPSRPLPRAARAFGHLLPGFGEPHAALVALDELRAEQVFELFDAGRQCGLRYELRLRGRMEVEARGKLDQVGKLTQRGERSHRGRAIG